MWTGVTSGLAGIKFSTSPSKYGEIRFIPIRSQIKKIKPNISLIEKKGWKRILFELEFRPNGLFDPVWCRKSKCSMTKAKMIKGRIK
jgi:hypothetical protein